MHSSSCLFLYNDPATTENYTYRHTLSLHYARPILVCSRLLRHSPSANPAARAGDIGGPDGRYLRAHRPLYATLRVARVMSERRDRDPDWQYGKTPRPHVSYTGCTPSLSDAALRSEGRRVGQEFESLCRVCWSPNNKKKTKTK